MKLKLLFIYFFLFSFCVQAEENFNSKKESDSRVVNSSYQEGEEALQKILQEKNPNLIGLKGPSLKNNTLIESEDYKHFFEVGLEYPINFGVQFKYLFLDEVYTRFSFGFMSSVFLDSFAKIAPSLGYFSSHEAKLLSDIFNNSMYLDLRLGWIPHLKKTGGGPYMEIGLSHSLHGKGELKGSNLNKVFPNSSFDSLQSYTAKINSYNANVHVGYTIPLEKVKLNLEVGLIKILTAKPLKFKDTQQELKGSKVLKKSQEAQVKRFLEKKGWIFPTVSAWISFTF